MEAFNFTGNNLTGIPSIVLDKAKGFFEISGECYPNEPDYFFEPVFQWLEEYKKKPNAETVFVFKMLYINTVSSKYIFNLMRKLESIPNAKIVWYYEADDEEEIEFGAEIKEMINAKIELVPY